MKANLRPRALPRRRRAVRGRRRPTLNRRVLKRTIQRVINKNVETKYKAFDYLGSFIYGNLNPDSDPTSAGGNVIEKRLFLAIPEISQGVASNQRIGNIIKPVRCKVTTQYYFVGPNLVGGQDLTGVQSSQLLEVRQVSLQPKAIKRYGEWTAAGAGAGSSGYKAVLPKLLESGGAGGVEYVPADTAAVYGGSLNMVYPLNNETVTPLAGNKHFIIGKNFGQIVGNDNNAPLANVRAQNTLHFSPKLPKVLKYEDGTVLPQNACPLFGAYAGQVVSNLGVTYDARQAPYVPITFGPTHPILMMNYRVELWYKDA